MVLIVLIGAVLFFNSATESLAADAKPDIEMVFVKGGCFDMGDTFGDGDYDEKPVHHICVEDFYIGKCEVTQKQWAEVMGCNQSHFKGCDDCPVENVRWNDTQDFIQRLNGRTGINYRLPFEAEWEYAARGGSWLDRARTTRATTRLNYMLGYRKFNLGFRLARTR